MKKQQLGELKLKTLKELESLAQKKKSELETARIDVVTQKTKNVHIIRNTRREIAQIKTIMSAAQLLEVNK